MRTAPQIISRLRGLSFLLVLAFSLAFPLQLDNYVNAAGPKTNNLVMLSPTDCPITGCAAGQRLNFRAEFDLAPQFSGGPNTQLCAYAPAPDWADTLTFNLTGLVSGTAYTTGETAGVCSANLPTGYAFAGGAFATLPSGAFADQLNFAMRINSTATSNGAVVVRVFQVAADGLTWSQSAQLLRNLSVAPAASTVYIANDALTCESYAPCYINSGDDLPDGLGTGLKDAIDAQTTPATLTLMGNYSIKFNTVLLNRAHTLQGINNSSLTYSGSLCSQPMLRITSGASLQNLNINGGSCVSTRRDLVVIESNSPVTILSNNLTLGKDALRMTALHNANVTVRANQISNNSGYAILWQNNASSGTLFAAANNLYNNRSGVQVECNSRGRTDHNFFGSGVLPSNAVSQCTATNAKRLGAAIQPHDGFPGVDAQRITVTNAKTAYFNQRIAFQHPSTTADFDIYVVNHGFGNTNNLPFFGFGTNAVTACSPSWDIFLSEGSLIPSSLTISVKYDLSPICIAMVESASYCGGSDPTTYPLLWYDPAGTVTAGWDNTGAPPQGSGAGGASGQYTVCQVDSDEIEVTIDSNGRPNFINDLYFTPFVVGIPYSSVIISNFTATPGGPSALIEWQTTSENNIGGFYVVRSQNSAGPYGRTSGFILSKGSTNIGGIYNYLDTNLQYGANYFYKLEVLDGSMQTLEFVGPASASLSTATPTITPTPTITLTPTRSLTPTITSTLSATYTQTPSRTFTLVPTRTRTPGIVFTNTRTLVPSFTYTATFLLKTSTNTPRPTFTTRQSPSKSPTMGTPGTSTPTLAGSGYPGGTPTSPQPTTAGSGYPVATPTGELFTPQATFTAGSAYPPAATPSSQYTPSITPGTLTITAQVRAGTLTALAPSSTATGVPPVQENGSGSAVVLILLILTALAVGGGLTWRYLNRQNIPAEDNSTSTDDESPENNPPGE